MRKAEPNEEKIYYRTFDEDTPITQTDIDSGKLVLRKRAAGRVLQAKKRVTLYLDVSVIDHFKRMAGERGYQTLINETLTSALAQTDIETTIRKVRAGPVCLDSKSAQISGALH